MRANISGLTAVALTAALAGCGANTGVAASCTVAVGQGATALVLGRLRARGEDGRFSLRAMLPRLPAGPARVTTNVPGAIAPLLVVR